MSLKVSVLGCGRLGLPLAKSLMADGYSVYGSATTLAKSKFLEKSGINSYVIKIDDSDILISDKSFFDADIAVVTLPFSREFKDPALYFRQIKSLTDIIVISPLKRVIFTSSTSIYPENGVLVDEDSDIDLINPRSRVLNDVEQLFLNLENINAAVLRFGGIWFGEVSAKLMLDAPERIIKNSLAEMNAVHVEDCVGSIMHLIKNFKPGEIFNVCCDKHPIRREFYCALSRRLGYNEPKFDGSKGVGKLVSNRKIKEILGYSFKYSDPLQF